MHSSSTSLDGLDKSFCWLSSLSWVLVSFDLLSLIVDPAGLSPKSTRRHAIQRFSLRCAYDNGGSTREIEGRRRWILDRRAIDPTTSRTQPKETGTSVRCNFPWSRRVVRFESSSSLRRPKEGHWLADVFRFVCPQYVNWYCFYQNLSNNLFKKSKCIKFSFQ